MQKYSLTKSELDFQSPSQKYFLDKDGNKIVGDELIHKMAKIATEFEKKGKAVPISSQRWVAWIKQFSKKLNEGKSSNEIFESTVSDTY